MPRKASEKTEKKAVEMVPDPLLASLISYIKTHDVIFPVSTFEPLVDVTSLFPQTTRRKKSMMLHNNIESLVHVRHRATQVEFYLCYKPRLEKAKKERMLKRLKELLPGFSYRKLLRNGQEKRPEFRPFYQYLPEELLGAREKRQVKANLEKFSAQLLVFVKDPRTCGEILSPPATPPPSLSLSDSSTDSSSSDSSSSDSSSPSDSFTDSPSSLYFSLDDSDESIYSVASVDSPTSGSPYSSPSPFVDLPEESSSSSSPYSPYPSPDSSLLVSETLSTSSPVLLDLMIPLEEPEEQPLDVLMTSNPDAWLAMHQGVGADCWVG